MAVKEVLEEMARYESDLQQTFDALEETPLGDSGRQVFHAIKFFMMSEKKHQKASRIRAMGLDKALANMESHESDRYNEQGLGRLKAAARSLEKGKEAIDKAAQKKFEEIVASDDFREELGRTRDTIRGHIIKTDFFGEVAGEIDEIWQEGISALEKDGPDGLTKFYEKNMRELADKRGIADRGRGPHSPIAWWKAVAIACIVGVGVWDIIHCYWWRGCRDVFRNSWNAIRICLSIASSCPP